MSTRSSSDGSWSKRKSVFALSTLRSVDHAEEPTTAKPSKAVKKPRTVRLPSIFTDLNHSAPDRDDKTGSTPPSATSFKSQHTRTSSINAKANRRPQVHRGGSQKNGVHPTAHELAGSANEPLYTTLSRTSSKLGEEEMDSSTPSKNVLLHGEVQTSAGIFRKKVEYLVLTESYLIRFKSQAKAAECFKAIPLPLGRSNTYKHTSMPSVGSQSEMQASSDSSGDKDGKVSLRQVVATYRLDDGKPYFAIEICFLDEDSAQAAAMTLQFSNPEERDYWSRNIRDATIAARARDGGADISKFNLEHAARIVERDNDYDPSSCTIYKVVQRLSTSRSLGRSSSDDLNRIASTVCFLAIGVHKLHLIQLLRPMPRSSSPALFSHGSPSSFGILTMTSIKLNIIDDGFELTFRQPLQKPVVLSLASAASPEIIARLHWAENYLRPAYDQRLFKCVGPPDLDDLLGPPVSAEDEENSSLDRTLTAYCIAYGVNPANLRYTINHQCEDAPRFELLTPADSRRPYGPLELLAVTRALRYNESFGGISFAGIPLDCLNGLHDTHGQEMVCLRTKRGTPIKLSPQELVSACLLVQEIRAMAATSKRLRFMDFSGCITVKHMTQDVSQNEPHRAREIGCGIVEALFPLCKHQTTNVDWICLNGIELGDTDLDYLVGAAVVKACHLRAIELNRCGLTDRSMSLILDALRVQENTLESLEIAGNTARLSPLFFDGQLGFFGFIRKLNLSNVSVTSGAESLLQADTLLMWKLEELFLSGTALNKATIDAVSTYLAHPRSSTLRELHIDNMFLSGQEISIILHSLAFGQTSTRYMHLDISQTQLSNGLDKVTEAISNGLTPSHLTMKAIEYKEEGAFRKMLNALTVNNRLRYLDMSQTALPCDASEETCRALERLLADNKSLTELNISGDDSRLATSVFGAGLSLALHGLKRNRTLRSLHVEKQKLRLPGASALAEILKENHTLQELFCDNNEIPLHGLTDLVNSLIDNTTLIYLPQMDDGRAAAFKDAEATMKVLSDVELPAQARDSKPSPANSASLVRKGFASVRRSAQRSTSSYTPSFPALPSYPRSTSSPEKPKPNAPMTLQLPSSRSRRASQGPVPAPVTSFTIQDIQTTHRLLTEQWDRQCYRLAQYLERNWCLLQDIPCNMEIEDEKFERPTSVGSIGKLLEQVKLDTTPKTERDAYFDSPPPHLPTTILGVDNKETALLGLTQFVTQPPEGPRSLHTPESLDYGDGGSEALWMESKVEAFAEPQTPTQTTPVRH